MLNTKQLYSITELEAWNSGLGFLTLHQGIYDIEITLKASAEFCQIVKILNK